MMNNLHIEETRHTPAVSFDYAAHALSLKGKSYPENTTAFYGPILESLKSYLDTTPKAFTLSIELSYFNSSSTKVLFNLFDLLEESADKGIGVTVFWLYDAENEVVEEAGADFKDEFAALDFRLKVSDG